jgi:hypothetical protein
VASASSRWELSGSYVTDDMYVCIIGFVELSRGDGGREHLPGTTWPGAKSHAEIPDIAVSRANE